MKKNMRTLLVLVALVVASSVANATTNATSATVTVYKAYFFENTLCTGTPQIADFGDSGRSVDMVAGGSFGAVTTVAAGTYNCVVFKMSDQVTFVPQDTDGACTAGASTTIDVCKDYGSGAPTTQDPETGTTSTCTGTVSADSTDTVFLYLSTTATTATGGSSNNPFLPPTTSAPTATAFNLNRSVVFSTTATGTFVFGTDGKVDGVTTGTCDMNPPDFGFSL